MRVVNSLTLDNVEETNGNMLLPPRERSSGLAE